MPRLLATGFSGPIGGALLAFLRERGYHVVRLVHGQPSEKHDVHWDSDKPLSPESVSGFDTVIHLAGETIVGRWTEAKKRAIRDSRVLGTQHLVEALLKAP
ncbi:MAG TPA: NAD-dependent epimerase/dehydratase family protein, partial [Terriglobales bacterium]